MTLDNSSGRVSSVVGARKPNTQLKFKEVSAAAHTAAPEITPMSEFARTIYQSKYAHTLPSGRKEEWPETARRVATSVMGRFLPELIPQVERAVAERKFIPGGRYLYAAGRRYPQIANCLSGDTRIVTRRGIRTLKALALVGEPVEVLNRHGKWEHATVRSFGVQKLLRLNFDNGDTVYATANHRWWQRDGSRVTTVQLEQVPLTQWADLPCISEEGVRHGVVYGDGALTNGGKFSSVGFCTAEKDWLAGCFKDEIRVVTVNNGAGVKYRTVRKKPSSPYRSVHLQPAHYKSLPDPEQCTPEYARGFIAGLVATDGCAKGATVSISCNGWANARIIRDLAVLGGCIVGGIYGQDGPTNYGKRSETNCVVRIRRMTAPLIRPDQVRAYTMKRRSVTKPWLDVSSVEVTDREEEVFCCVVPGSESFTLANGVVTSNCFLFRTNDSREGWADLSMKNHHALMTGGGVGCVYSDVRPEDMDVGGMGGKATGPCAPMNITNECGRHIMQGGSRRSALWAGLHWWHPDVDKFIHIKDWPEEVRALKHKDFNFPAPMDGTNVSVILDSDFFAAYTDPNWSKTYRKWGITFTLTHRDAHRIYWLVVRRMLKTGEPGFSVDNGRDEECCRNACCEITSADDGDNCNLGSINLGRVSSYDEFCELVRLGTAFLICGTLYGVLPLPLMERVREKNRRIGLGTMGGHDWLMQRGRRYGPDAELARWLEAYARNLEHAWEFCDRLGISRSVAGRSKAPNGTISIVAETTSCWEPMYAAGVKRRYLKGKEWHYQYKVDATAHRLVRQGADPATLEDAYTLAEDVGRRIEMQAWLQQYVDHGISSTVNLPAWGSSLNNESTVDRFGRTLMTYLPRLRGFTAYPDGARGGQPLTRVPYTEAVKHLGTEYAEVGESAYREGASCQDGFCSS